MRDVEVVEAYPRAGVFDNAARRALARWRFQPKRVDGRPVASRAEITLNFSLQEG
ncbi:energy transducer TonB [Alkalilimnicola ehrlichii]|uniref:energy transducer TonB n=1 Tax=Alkalilimnicola ehrlichii TaxID=351052 RepID=UPI001C6EB663